MRVSASAAPVRRSLPGPPSTWSVPVPASTTSSASPPRSRSLPSPPEMVSSPAAVAVPGCPPGPARCPGPARGAGDPAVVPDGDVVAGLAQKGVGAVGRPVRRRVVRRARERRESLPPVAERPGVVAGRAADQVVVAPAAVQLVRAGAALEVVATLPAGEKVVAALAEHPVRVAPGVDVVAPPVRQPRCPWRLHVREHQRVGRSVDAREPRDPSTRIGRALSPAMRSSPSWPSGPPSPRTMSSPSATPAPPDRWTVTAVR